MIKRFLFLLTLFIYFISCKKEESNEFRMRGVVRDASNNSPIENVDVTVYQQEVSGGSFNGNFIEASDANSNSAGIYDVSWIKKNIVSVEVEATKDLWIPSKVEISGAKYKPGEVVYQDFFLHPESKINVTFQRLTNQWNTLNFRFENAIFDCNCCDNDWRSISSTTSESNFECRGYGDSWLKYRYELISTSQDSLVQDSIYLTRFETKTVVINW